MRTRSQLWRANVGWLGAAQPRKFRADLILAFGSGHVLAETRALHDLQQANSQAIIASISTAGEICGESVFDDSIVALAMEFESTRVRASAVSVRDGETSDQVAERLAAEIATDELAHVIVFSVGLHVNGSGLAFGLSSRLPSH
ncbi:MAG: hypothetical protein H7Z40_07145, partial [Phycisphaerae bacterium]|nr:hypothetical protein [Gemmatimonadaceae bacterium]